MCTLLNNKNNHNSTDWGGGFSTNERKNNVYIYKKIFTPLTIYFFA